MTRRRSPSVTHSTIVIERSYAAAPGRVFAAWASREAKARWYACDGEWQVSLHELDFRVGGREMLQTGPAGGPVHAFDGIYHHIVPGERIVYSYAMHVGDSRISVSLATVEFRPQRRGTTMVFTEQIAILDELTTAAEREEGTRLGLDGLDSYLRGQNDP